MRLLRSSRVYTAVSIKLRVLLDLTLRCCTNSTDVSKERHPILDYLTLKMKTLQLSKRRVLLDAKDKDITIVETSVTTLPATQRHIPDLYLLRMLFSNLTHRLFQVAFFPTALVLSNTNPPSTVR
jgi:hypothetical protein